MNNMLKIFVTNGLEKKHFLFTKKLKIIDFINTNGPVVDMLFYGGQRLGCTIGK
jgi:hypothetical protein